MAWKDPLLELLAKGNDETDNLPLLQNRSDRPPLVRSRLGRVGRVPAGAVDCTLGEIADTGLTVLRRRLHVPDDQWLRVAYNMNFFDWRPWGQLHNVRRVTGSKRGGKHRDPDYNGGYVSTHTPGATMGQGVILRDNLDLYRAWLWTLDTERAEDVYLTRRRPRALNVA